MRAIIKIIRSIHYKILTHSSSEEKIKYWRKRGVKIGENCILETMAFSTEPYLIEIGNHCAIAYGTVLITHDGSLWCFDNELKGDLFGMIKIGNNVHIGMNCTILMNTTIGDNCIIGAGSVVRGQFPANSVIVGNPAKVVLNMNAQKMLFRMSSGLINTKGLSYLQKKRIALKHFGLK